MSPEDVSALIQRLADNETRMERLERRLANTVREGRVSAVDYEKGLAEVEMDGLPSRMIPWVQRAGTVKDWDPPSEGERVVVLSPTGDLARGMVLPGGWSEENPAPDNRGGARTITTEGDFSAKAGADALVKAGADVTIEAEGKIVLRAPSIEIRAAAVDFIKEE